MRSGPFSNRAPIQASILLVDDNRDGILARRSVLEELGYEVVTASCGFDALKIAGERTFDLIITDYKMSPMDGLELISNLRGLDFKTPIILLTGFAESLGLLSGNTGADVVIQKSANEVANLIRHAKRLLNPRKPASSQTPRKAKAARSAAGEQ